MNNFEILTADNFLLYCIKHYDNPQCSSTEEFFEDIMRLKYIKKLITRYIDSGDLRERLILNHLIVLSNVFKPEVLCKIIWLKFEPEYLECVKPFLIMLNILPDKIYNVGEQNVINTVDIGMDQMIINKLRTI